MPNRAINHCHQCPYLGRRNRLPLSMEINSLDVLLVFQAPGIYEWRYGRPICSPSPKSAAARIRNSLCRIGKSRRDFSITNAVQCYPGKKSNGRDKCPNRQACRHCAQRLRNDIVAYDWRKIIVFGTVAEWSVRHLGYHNDRRFRFLFHPASRKLTNYQLDGALRWANL